MNDYQFHPNDINDNNYDYCHQFIDIYQLNL